MYVTALGVLKLGFLTLILKRGDLVAFQSATLFLGLNLTLTQDIFSSPSFVAWF